MRLYIDLDSLSLVETPGFRSPVQALRFKRGDGVPLELQFYRGNEAVVLPAGTVIHLAAKQRNDFHGEELISCDNFQTHPATGETVYASTPAINREPLTQIFSPANATPPVDLVLMAEISWRTPGQLPITTATFDLIVSNDIIKDDIEYFAKFTANIADIYRTVIRSSRISQADALEKARRAAVDLCLNVAQDPTFLELPYPYQVRTYEERIIRILFSGDSDLSHKIRGPEIGRITENRYCAEVLNTPRVMFVDVDTVPENPDKPNSMEDRSTAPLISEAEADALLDQFCLANPNFGFRVYRTFAGLRYICTSGLFDPTSQLVKDVLTTLNADQSYRVLCKIQKCFRARLTPKPWRLDGSVVWQPHTFRTLDFSALGYVQFRQSYLAAMGTSATCHFIRTVGNPIVHPECAEILAVHDTRTNSHTSLPLA